MRRSILVCLGMTLLPACGAEKYDYFSTPAGYRLAWENVGAVPGWYSLVEIGMKFDGAVEEAVAYLDRYGVEAEVVRAVARSHRHIGFDAARFAIDASHTGWASGAYYTGSSRVALAFWSRAKGDVVPDDAPAWTVYSWPERPSPAYDWGFGPPFFPALGHEYCHAFFGPMAEHVPGYPPVVRGVSLASIGKWEGDCAYVNGRLED